MNTPFDFTWLSGLECLQDNAPAFEDADEHEQVLWSTPNGFVVDAWHRRDWDDFSKIKWMQLPFSEQPPANAPRSVRVTGYTTAKPWKGLDPVSRVSTFKMLFLIDGLTLQETINKEFSDYINRANRIGLSICPSRNPALLKDITEQITRRFAQARKKEESPAS